MQYARAVIAAVLATGLVVIVIVQELATSVFTIAFPEAVIDLDEGGGLIFDATFLLLVVSIIILTVPDAIAYVRRKKLPEPPDEEDE